MCCAGVTEVAFRSDYDGGVLRYLVQHTPLKRLAHGIPVAYLLLAANVALLARIHLAKLDGAQRRRLVALGRKAGGHRGSLSKAEREELAGLVAILEPRLFLGSAAKRLSPVPVPKRVLYGPRGSTARTAAKERS